MNTKKTQIQKIIGTRSEQMQVVEAGINFSFEMATSFAQPRI